MKWMLGAGLVLLPILVYMACSRMTEQRSVPVIQKRLLRWEHSGDSNACMRLVMDKRGRVVRMENDAEINVFRYWKDSLELTELAKADQKLVYVFNGRLDSLGKLVSGTAIASYIPHDPDTVVHRFEYSADGYLVKEYRDYGQAGDYIITYTYDQGDAVKICTWYNDELYNTKELEYYPEHYNHTGIEDFKFRRNINQLAGFRSRHLVKRITSTARNGKLNYAFNYEYETDAAGLRLKSIARNGIKVSGVTTYYYAGAMSYGSF